jgi:integrase
VPEHAEKNSVVMAERGDPGLRIHDRAISQRIGFLGTLWNLRVGPHSFRHIVATDWLKRYPNDFATVAGFLHETETTVRIAYAHLVTADHTRRSNREHQGLSERARRHLGRAALLRR